VGTNLVAGKGGQGGLDSRGTHLSAAQRPEVDPADPRVALVLFGDAAGLELAVLRLDDVGQVDAGALAARRRRRSGGWPRRASYPPATV
jgi:hypothetical protein